MDLAAQVNIKTYQVPQELPHSIFRTYDIRGPVAEDAITEDVAYAIGLAIGSEAREYGVEEFIVGRDGRLSGPVLKAAMLAGLMQTGLRVIDIGVVPTPLVYFATNKLSANSGVMITASHNPGDHNGFKVVLNGKTLTTEGVQNIYQRIKAQSFVKGKGDVREQNIVPDYIRYVADKIKLARPLKVVVDCGNGVAGNIVGDLYRTLGCEVTELYCEVDGHFPNHHPDPTIPENLQDLIAKVKEVKADLGLAFDGDADRVGVVTNKGDIIWPDRQMMLYASDVLSHYPGEKIVFDVKCSSNLAKLITAKKGVPVMYRTGHSILKSKMLELNAPLAGEMSGHIFFNDEWFGFDDGMYVGARLMRILASSPSSLSEIFDLLPNSYNTPELKLPMAEDKKTDFMHRLLTEGNFGKAERITIDGLRVEFADGWGLVRPSNTSPYLILRFEADNEKRLDEIKELFRRELLKIEKDLKLPF